MTAAPNDQRQRRRAIGTITSRRMAAPLTRYTART